MILDFFKRVVARLGAANSSVAVETALPIVVFLSAIICSSFVRMILKHKRWREINV